MAIEDRFPVAPTHVLVIPRRHVDSLHAMGEADRDLLGHLLLVARAVAEKRGVHETGYRVLTNVGKEGGQTVHHFHLHVLGGKQMGPKLGG